MRNILVTGIGGLVAAAALVVAAAPASGDLTEPPGRCVGSAAFAEGVDGPFTISSTALEPGDVTTIPLHDTVTWSGSLVGVTAQPREISGYVKVDMPWPIPDLTLDEWDGSSSRTENRDVKDYSLPSITPRGVELHVFGEHREAGTVFCSGSATVKVDGSRLGVFALASIVLLAASVALALLASRRASAALGTFAGFVTLLFAGLVLLFLGILPLNSALLTILPIVGLPLGLAWGKAALLSTKVAAAP